MSISLAKDIDMGTKFFSSTLCDMDRPASRECFSFYFYIFLAPCSDQKKFAAAMAARAADASFTLPRSAALCSFERGGARRDFRTRGPLAAFSDDEVLILTSSCERELSSSASLFARASDSVTVDRGCCCRCLRELLPGPCSLASAASADSARILELCPELVCPREQFCEDGEPRELF